MTFLWHHCLDLATHALCKPSACHANHIHSSPSTLGRLNSACGLLTMGEALEEVTPWSLALLWSARWGWREDIKKKKSLHWRSVLELSWFYPFWLKLLFKSQMNPLLLGFLFKGYVVTWNIGWMKEIWGGKLLWFFFKQCSSGAWQDCFCCVNEWLWVCSSLSSKCPPPFFFFPPSRHRCLLQGSNPTEPSST